MRCFPLNNFKISTRTIWNFHMLHTNYPSFLILSLKMKTKCNVLKKVQHFTITSLFFFFCEEKRGGGKQRYLLNNFFNINLLLTVLVYSQVLFGYKGSHTFFSSSLLSLLLRLEKEFWVASSCSIQWHLKYRHNKSTKTKANWCSRGHKLCFLHYRQKWTDLTFKFCFKHLGVKFIWA